MPDNKDHVAIFDGGYGRVGTIDVVMGICSVCNKPRTVIQIDASEKEYKPGSICYDCVKEHLYI